jgi:hypothetical protein
MSPEQPTDGNAAPDQRISDSTEDIYERRLQAEAEAEKKKNDAIALAKARAAKDVGKDKAAASDAAKDKAAAKTARQGNHAKPAEAPSNRPTPPAHIHIDDADLILPPAKISAMLRPARIRHARQQIALWKQQLGQHRPDEHLLPAHIEKLETRLAEMTLSV